MHILLEAVVGMNTNIIDAMPFSNTTNIMHAHIMYLSLQLCATSYTCYTLTRTVYGWELWGMFILTTPPIVSLVSKALFCLFGLTAHVSMFDLACVLASNLATQKAIAAVGSCSDVQKLLRCIQMLATQGWEPLPHRLFSTLSRSSAALVGPC
jgi:hypothetical protein